jgi:hypothetical protein
MRIPRALLRFLVGAGPGFAAGCAVFVVMDAVDWPVAINAPAHEFVRWGIIGAVVGGFMGLSHYSDFRAATQTRLGLVFTTAFFAWVIGGFVGGLAGAFLGGDDGGFPGAIMGLVAGAAVGLVAGSLIAIARWIVGSSSPCHSDKPPLQ